MSPFFNDRYMQESIPGDEFDELDEQVREDAADTRGQSHKLPPVKTWGEMTDEEKQELMDLI